MPEISRFFGIIITMYADDHNPPHFHARNGEYNAMFDINSGELIEGEMQKKSLKLIQAWIEIHREELLANWEESKKEHPSFKPINPLN